MRPQQVSSAFKVEVDGSPLAKEAHLSRVEVDHHLHLPDAFVLSFRDGDRNALTSSTLKIGSEVKISVSSFADQAPVTLIEAEVTALEAEYHGKVRTTVVRGYDRSHRLFRGTVSESHLNMSYSDVVQKVIKRHDLEPGTIDSSPTHPHIAQANESDWTFLSRLADEIGYELTLIDKKLHFRQPSGSAAAPNGHDLSSDDPLALAPGHGLKFIRTSITASGQVPKVEVVAYDVRKKTTVHAEAVPSTDATTNGSTTEKVAKVFDSPSLVCTGQTLLDERDAERAAKARGDRVAASHTEIEAEADGNPKLRAGAAIRLMNMGDPFDGKYLVSTAKHLYDVHDGYVTWFTVSGRQDRSTLALTGGASGPTDSVEGVVAAEVDDVDDPDHLGRVRLRFPWMSPSYVSDWSPVMQLGAGKNRGLFVMPEVHDQVLVAFNQGDVRQPFVLGGLHNDEDQPADGPGALIDGSSKEINRRMFTSRTGHQVVFVDHSSDSAVILQTSDKKLQIRLDEAHHKVEITSSGDLDITSGGKLNVKATGELHLEGAMVTVKGQPIRLN